MQGPFRRRPHRLPVWLVFGTAILFPALALGQDREKIFVFSSDPDKLVDPKADLDVRPNTGQEFYLFVKNPTDDDRELTVELRGPTGSNLVARQKVPIPRGQYARVRFAKPAPQPAPAVPPALPAPTPKAENAPPLPPPPPPGTELKRAEKGGYRFMLRLLDEKGRPLLDDNKKPYEREVTLAVRPPGGYVDTPVIKLTRSETARRLDVTVTSSKTFRGSEPCVVELVFPPQPGLLVEKLRAGVYRRTITKAEQTVRLVADNLPVVEGAEERVRFYVNIDGVPRAFIFEPDFRRPTEAGLLRPVTALGVRLGKPDMPRPKGERSVPLPIVPEGTRLEVFARPVDKFPVRVEVDNPKVDTTLRLRIDRVGDGTFSEPDETTAPMPPYEEHVWLEPSGPGESFLVNTRVSDWVIGVDTRDLRGRHDLEALARTPAKPNDEQAIARAVLVLDDTPPESVAFGRMPKQHIKGRPLPVLAVAYDPESPIKGAVFFLGKLGPDGKLAPTAVKAEGRVVPGKTRGTWVATAELPLAPDAKGPVEVGVLFTNEVDLVTAGTQTVILIDPPPPPTLGVIEGRVELGGRGQPGLNVILRDADGKDKAAAGTDATGAFKFERVPPGLYRVVTSKPDSGVGTRGETPVTVEAGKVSKATIALTRRPQ